MLEQTATPKRTRAAGMYAGGEEVGRKEKSREYLPKEISVATEETETVFSALSTVEELSSFVLFVAGSLFLPS